MVDNLLQCFTFPPTQHTVSFETKRPIVKTKDSSPGVMSGYQRFVTFLRFGLSESTVRRSPWKDEKTCRSNDFSETQTCKQLSQKSLLDDLLRLVVTNFAYFAGKKNYVDQLQVEIHCVKFNELPTNT